MWKGRWKVSFLLWAGLLCLAGCSSEDETEILVAQKGGERPDRTKAFFDKIRGHLPSFFSMEELITCIRDNDL